jgi:hypothetical protein
MGPSSCPQVGTYPRSEGGFFFGMGEQLAGSGGLAEGRAGRSPACGFSQTKAQGKSERLDLKLLAQGRVPHVLNATPAQLDLQRLGSPLLSVDQEETLHGVLCGPRILQQERLIGVC